MTGPFNRIIEAVAAIAQKLGATVSDSGNRLADNLEGIAEVAGGGGSSVLLVGLIQDEQTGDYRLDKTWQEIHDAAPLVWFADDGAYLPLIGVIGGESEAYLVVFLSPRSGVAQFVTDSVDGYPVEGGAPSPDGDGEVAGDSPKGENGEDPR